MYNKSIKNVSLVPKKISYKQIKRRAKQLPKFVEYRGNFYYMHIDTHIKNNKLFIKETLNQLIAKYYMS